MFDKDGDLWFIGLLIVVLFFIGVLMGTSMPRSPIKIVLDDPCSSNVTRVCRQYNSPDYIADCIYAAHAACEAQETE